MEKKVIKNKYDFIVLFDVKNKNPNKDPDTGMARVNPLTNQGIITNFCLKRKIRNYVERVKKDSEGYDIYIKQGSCLESTDKKSYKELLNVDSIEDLKSIDRNIAIKLKNYMCDKFYDIRTFGAVMETFSESVKGTVQIAFAESVDPILNKEITIGDKRKKYIVPYGLYVMKGHISAIQAEENGFTEEDLELLWEAIANMFTSDNLASKGKMNVREFIVFEHSSKFGDCQAYKLNESINVKKKDDVIYPRSYKDYEVSIDTSEIPDTVTVRRL